MTATITDILKKHWGYQSFRPLQEDIIRSVLEGKDTLALMPTGGGKSLCYQVPALAMDGMCLVVSPLIALMKDQVSNLRRKNITAYSIYSGMSRKEVINILQTVTRSNCKFLYVSPERLETSLFKEYLPGMHINLLAVDEAHCISQWGYDFRPSYLRIAALREELHDVPVLALTASATTEVQEDICARLNVPDSVNPYWKIFRQSFERPNLSYSVFKPESRIHKIIEVLSRVSGTSIVYCKSRKRTKEISELLQLQGISADYYHAGLSQEDRNRKQESWINNQVRVIVCTNAFGMGIDKPDVRTVVHADVPDCLENYYQEAGRAGRDSKTSFAVLLYNEAELKELSDSIPSRFPSLADIRLVYQAVANYLQIPENGGKGEYFAFDMADFLRKFSMNGQTALYSLKALEQDGWLSFNEQVFLPPTILFTITKEKLYEFEKDHADLEPVIKTLLRAYDGIFDHPAFISELSIAQLLKVHEDDVKGRLARLDKAGIIEYNPRKDSPQLYFLRQRIRSSELTIDMQAYGQRKQKAIDRLAELIRFVKEGTDCRSRIIGNYFGDKEMKACGICDNCLRQKAASITQEEFDAIYLRITSIVEKGRLEIKDLLGQLGGVKKEKAWRVIEHLQAENKIQVDGGVWLKMK
ncbi:MAG: RecQ family ATP-dependent DNA helicase [Chitinophagaceae bacterium]|nr:RecQ family ATP-dependent DNA helicase [Chitinophagaceae bacterium]